MTTSRPPVLDLPCVIHGVSVLMENDVTGELKLFTVMLYKAGVTPYFEEAATSLALAQVAEEWSSAMEDTIVFWSRVASNVAHVQIGAAAGV